MTTSLYVTVWPGFASAGSTVALIDSTALSHVSRWALAVPGAARLAFCAAFSCACRLSSWSRARFCASGLGVAGLGGGVRGQHTP